MVRRPLETEGTEGVEERNKNSSTQIERGRREEKYIKHQLYSSVCRISKANSPFIGRVRNKSGVT
jgi:hypothetical protein